jgi:dCTP deaminase
VILSDREIAEYAQKGMIDPFINHQVSQVNGQKVISYGLSSYGYDIRIASEFKKMRPGTDHDVDPLNFHSEIMEHINTDNFIRIEPHSFVLGHSIEWFDIPRELMSICLGKSTLARCGLVVNITPLESEWRGRITVEISNTTPRPARVYAGQGVAQVLFLKASQVCQVSYADREGKYQDQVGVVLPR